MNEKQVYQDMIEMHENTCNITCKPVKKKKKKASSEEIKNKVIEKVNSTVQPEQTEEQPKNIEEPKQDYTANVRPYVEKKKLSFKFTAISVQVVIIGVLLATIFLTNALNANSGINTFFKSVFGGEQVSTVDARVYSDFVPTLNYDDNSLMLDAQGVITIEGVGSIYSAVNGKVKSIVRNQETGKFTVEVSHSDTFTSVYTGLDYVYAEEGANVFSNLPLGYTENSVDLCFYSADTMITDYKLVDDEIVWAV